MILCYPFSRFVKLTSFQIFEFLVVFPPQERVRQFVRNTETTAAQLFPLDKPYKLLYSIRCLATCLKEEALESEPNAEFIAHSSRALVDFLTQPDMDAPENNPLKLSFVSNAVDCLLVALSAKRLPNASEEFFPEPSSLASRLLSIQHLGLKVAPDYLPEEESQKMVSNTFAVLIEASLHDNRVWDTLKENTHNGEVITELFLVEPRSAVRKEAAEIIFKLCGQSPSQKQSKAIDSSTGKLSNPTAIDIVAALWKCFLCLLPESLNYPTTSQEFFEAALVLFHTVIDLSPDGFDFGAHLKEWGSILLEHKTAEFVGREPVDFIVWGFSLLMKACLELAPSGDVAEGTSSLVNQLFTTYLFPDLSEDNPNEPIEPNIPVMHSGTRRELYQVLGMLCENAVNCRLLLENMEVDIPRGKFIFLVA